MDIINDMVKRDGHIHHFIIAVAKDIHRQAAAGLDGEINQFFGAFRQVGILFGQAFNGRLGERGHIHIIGLGLHIGRDHRHLIVVIDFFQGHLHQWQDMWFNFHGIKSIIPVRELDDFIFVVAHSHIVFHLQIFQAFDQAALDITRLWGLDGRINNTDTTTHSVEEEFRRGQARDKGVFDKPTRGRRVIKFREMR